MLWILEMVATMLERQRRLFDVVCMCVCVWRSKLNLLPVGRVGNGILEGVSAESRAIASLVLANKQDPTGSLIAGCMRPYHPVFLNTTRGIMCISCKAGCMYVWWVGGMACTIPLLANARGARSLMGICAEGWEAGRGSLRFALIFKWHPS